MPSIFDSGQSSALSGPEIFWARCMGCADGRKWRPSLWSAMVVYLIGEKSAIEDAREF